MFTYPVKQLKVKANNIPLYCLGCYKSRHNHSDQNNIVNIYIHMVPPKHLKTHFKHLIEIVEVASIKEGVYFNVKIYFFSSKTTCFVISSGKYCGGNLSALPACILRFQAT